MSNQQFIIEVLNLHWINNIDDGNDLCVHGHLYLKIGDTIISNEESGDWTLSSTALYLLRTLENNYKNDGNSTQILPCCGHVFYYDGETEKVIIQGCYLGVDWEVIHEENQVKLVLENGEATIVDINEYRKIVLDFADKIEAFYNNSHPRNLPIDDFDKKGYLAFKKEWRTLRDKW